jgi:MtfA peptidase
MASRAHAALIGAAQNTNYFESVKWVYLESDGDNLSEDGSAMGCTTVRIKANKLLAESQDFIEGSNVAIHEFAHVLDHYLNVISNSSQLKEEFEANQKLCAIENQYCIYDDGGSQCEFFAYASELFFTDSNNLKANRPKLYDWFVSIYGIDVARLLIKNLL